MASGNSDTAKKVLTLAQVQELAADKEKCIMIIDDHVYDITKFIDEVRAVSFRRSNTSLSIACSIRAVKKS